VHRGMWHSIPAAAVAGLLAFILVSGDILEIRLFKAGGVVLGFLCHLVMDEMWSVEVSHGIPRLKSSFGTALKFYTTISLWSNISVYGKLIALLAFVICDPYLMKQLDVDQGELPQSANAWFASAADHGKQIYHNLLRRKGAQANSPAAMFERLDPTPQNENGNLAPAFGTGNAIDAVQQSVAPVLPGGNTQSPPEPPPYPAPPAAESARRPSYYPGSESPVRR